MNGCLDSINHVQMYENFISSFWCQCGDNHYLTPAMLCDISHVMRSSVLISSLGLGSFGTQVLPALHDLDKGCAIWEVLWQGQWRSEKASSQTWVLTSCPDLWLTSTSLLCKWAHVERQVLGTCCSCPCTSCSPDWQLYCGAKWVENLEAVLLREWSIKRHVFVQKRGLFSLNKKENPFGISRAEKYFFNRAVRKWN